MTRPKVAIISPSQARQAGGILQGGELVEGVGGSSVGSTDNLSATLAGATVPTWALVMPGYEGPPLVGMPLLDSVRGIAVLDAPDRQAWVWVPQKG